VDFRFVAVGRFVFFVVADARVDVVDRAGRLEAFAAGVREDFRAAPARVDFFAMTGPSDAGARVEAAGFPRVPWVRAAARPRGARRI
jgi:hypothetical protein